METFNGKDGLKPIFTNKKTRYCCGLFLCKDVKKCNIQQRSILTLYSDPAVEQNIKIFNETTSG